MNEIATLPRATYTNTADLSPLHDLLDRDLPRFKEEMLGRHWPNVIGGVGDASGAAIECFSPLDSSLLVGTYPTASEYTVRRAVAAARIGAAAWSALPWRRRLDGVRRLSRVIDEHRHRLAMALLFEVGKTRTEALGEAEEAVALIAHYADQLEKNHGFVESPWKSFDGRETAQTLLRPYGVFGVIAPFNYPLALPVNMMAAAITAGNAVVFKPTPNGALVAGMLADAFREADLPAGTFNLVYGAEAGQLLVDEPGIDGIAFTGSHQTGTSILRKFASGPFMRPVLAEMGGKNHAYVDSSADLDIAIEGVARSAFGMQGQRCTACSVALIHESVYDEFMAGLIARAKIFKAGDTTRREITSGPLINEASFNRYWAAADHAATVGKIEAGGRRLVGDALDRGYFVMPTVLSELPVNDEIFRTEIFAPIIAVSRFADLSEALQRGNSTNLGLTAGYYGREPSRISKFVENVQVGVIYVNRLTGATNGAWPGIQSFSGWKGSGLTGKGGLGPHYLPQFMREQSRTIRELS